MKKKSTSSPKKKKSSVGLISGKSVKQLRALEKTKAVSKPFPIVAIGASAGGLEAVTELLKNLSPETGMAYIYIQHLDPNHQSMLSNILAKATDMSVMEAEDKMIIQANCFYVIPPNKEMYILDGVLRLNARPLRPALSLPINRFFMSLAEKQKKGAIGIVLSGNASDGALGLKAIKTAGGFTFAQDNSARFNSMPRSAIAEGSVDMILSPAKIGKELERLSKNAHLLHSIMDEGKEMHETPVDAIPLILDLLRQNTEVDFTHYKAGTIHRRIIRRMLLHRLPSLKEYSKFLRNNKQEVNVLYNDLLINVTNFFRDSDTMDYMRKELIPRIIKMKQGSEIRVWVPACSTGEEAYSLAMLLSEALGDKASTTQIQIFATDLSEPSVAKARLGLYSKSALENVSEARLKRFFTKTDSSFRISKSIRDMCIFAPHNVFTDPPFSRIDLVSCCNLLIYLDPVLQRKLLSVFHYSLNPGGFLALGKSESITSSQQLFSPLDKKVKLYVTKKDGKAQSVFEMPARLENDMTRHVPHAKAIGKKHDGPDLDKLVDRLLLSDYVPASVVINKDMEIVQFRGSTGMFLEPSPGKASLNLLKMARPGLNFELRSAVHKVIKTGEPVKKSGIGITYKNAPHHVSIEVVLLKSSDEPHYLIIFEEVATSPQQDGKEAGGRAQEKRNKQLEAELLSAREDMRSIIEEQEAVNEELQSANEEVVSSNEELQSINEELETSKEELESTNEELTSMNSELLIRNEQLNESYDYGDAILSTLREALLVLDRDLRVVSANKSFYKIFQSNEEKTIHNLLFELGDGQWNLPQLKLKLHDVISQNSHFENYEVELDFPQVGPKIMVLNGRMLVQKFSRQELILLAIEDITEHTIAQRVLKDREEWIRSIADNAPVMIWTSDIDGKRTFFNKTWQEFTGRKVNDDSGDGWQKSINPVDREEFLKIYFQAVKERMPFRAEYRLQRADGKYRWVVSVAKPVFNPAGIFEGMIGTVTESPRT
ncbi:MAG: CheR family methyltransferase [Bacteroidota bacterium]